MRTALLFTFLAAGMAGAGDTAAQDAAAGEEIYQSVCKNCHGPKAQGMASFPELAGSTAEHIVMRLEQYRAGETVGPNTPLMRPQAVDLSDEDIADLASYITSLD